MKKLWGKYRNIKLIYRIAFAFILGSIMGLFFGESITIIKPLGDIFIRLLKMIIIPVVILTLVNGMRKLSFSKLGKVGFQTVAVYIITTAIAVIIGLLVANMINPGIGMTISETSQLTSKEAPNLIDVIMNIVPENIFNALSGGNLLQTIFIAIIFGLSLSILQEESNENMERIIKTIFDIIEIFTQVTFKIVWGIMEYGVIGVFALMADVFGNSGINALIPFSKLILSLFLASLLHIIIIYLLIIIKLLVGHSPIAFLKGTKDALLTALSIRSSSGTLPVTMSNAKENLRINESIYSFSLPLGATINMDGTALYLGLIAVFSANIVGVSLTLMEQAIVILIGVIASVGSAGVPGSALIMLTMVLTQLGFPLSIIGIVAGLDPLLDRIRTMNNVAGDLAVTSLIAKWNNGIDLSKGVWEDNSK